MLGETKMTRITRPFLVGVWVRIFFAICFIADPVKEATALSKPVLFVKQKPVSFVSAVISTPFRKFFGNRTGNFRSGPIR